MEWEEVSLTKDDPRLVRMLSDEANQPGLEKALKATYGETEWQERFNRLKYSEVVKTSQIKL